MPLDPRVSSPCNRSGSTAESATLAAVATAVWMIFVLLSTPTCAFIPKYPLFALLRLVHLRIALLLPVLGRSGCVQDGRVHDRARRDSHPLRLQVQVHLPQDLFPQLVFFQQVPELAHRGLVRHRLTA